MLIPADQVALREDGLGFVTGVLIIALLVIVILELTGHHVVMKR